MRDLRVLILGATGQIGNAMFRVFARDAAHDVYGTVRDVTDRQYFDPALAPKLITGVNVENRDTLVRLFAETQPDVVINCVGLVKQLAKANDPLQAIPYNSLLPHWLAAMCDAVNARLVHISTDCVFSGEKGNYLESDTPDATDLYGRSKILGEVDYPHAVTLRTSTIGHEPCGNHGLLGWFLSQSGSTKGYSKAVFSGLPTNEFARVVKDLVLPKPELTGLYHVAAAPIDKYQLLMKIADVYKKDIEITPDDQLKIDRSLNADLFRRETGYIAPSWDRLIEQMHEFFQEQY
jgi:dTDP-4-dehydrorhamnose reductase